MKANLSTQGVDAVTVCRMQRHWSPLSLPCVFTGTLLDKAAPEGWDGSGYPLQAEQGRAEGDKVGFLAVQEQHSKGYTRSSSVGFGSNRPAGTLKTYFELQSIC